jgi:actin-like ATPase involved in cell morphogenesis
MDSAEQIISLMNERWGIRISTKIAEQIVLALNRDDVQGQAIPFEIRGRDTHDNEIRTGTVSSRDILRAR